MAIVANVVWACLAGFAIAVPVAALVAGIVRTRRPPAATRFVLWAVVLGVAALGPLGIVAAMVARHDADPATDMLTSGPVARLVRPSVAGLDDVLHGRAASRTEMLPHPRLHTLLVSTGPLRKAPALPENVALGLAIVWVAGALAGLTGLALSIARVRGLKARSSRLDASPAAELPWLTESTGREIYLRLSYEIETPIAVGFRRPVILVPVDMADAGGLSAIEPLIIHEFAHLARYDDWTNLAQRLLERVLWFNPLVWYAGRRMALEREVAADDAVIARTNDATEYAGTLWRMAREMRMPEHVVVAPGAMVTRKQISVRIERMLEETRGRRPQVGVGLAVALLAACTIAAVAATAPPLVTVPSTLPAEHAAAVPPLPAIPAVPGDATGGTHLTRATIVACPACDYSGRDLSGIDLSGLTFAGAKFQSADLHDANLSGVQVFGGSFDDANLSGARLNNARFFGVSLDGSNFTRASFAGARFVGSTLDVAALHANGSLRSVVADCAGCNFAGADLHGQDLHGLTLDDANFDGADLRDANLRGARLSAANLSGAHLDRADLTGASLTGANLSGASMAGTRTTGADMRGAALP